MSTTIHSSHLHLLTLNLPASSGQGWRSKHAEYLCFSTDTFMFPAFCCRLTGGRRNHQPVSARVCSDGNKLPGCQNLVEQTEQQGFSPRSPIWLFKHSRIGGLLPPCTPPDTKERTAAALLPRNQKSLQEYLPFHKQDGVTGNQLDSTVRTRALSRSSCASICCS